MSAPRSDRATTPLVIDADALNAFAGDPDRLRGREGREVIITPHPGEMARLVGMSADEVQASRLEIARNFAVSQHVYVILKGHRTLIATPDEKVFINPTGNPGMATGGSGDVLAGRGRLLAPYGAAAPSANGSNGSGPGPS